MIFSDDKLKSKLDTNSLILGFIYQVMGLAIIIILVLAISNMEKFEFTK